MKAGDTITLYCARQTASGLPAYSRTLGDFVVSLNGAQVTPTSFTEVGVPQGSEWDWYSFQVTLPSAAQQNLYLIEPAQTQYVTDSITPGMWGGFIQANDEDSLAALMLLTQGVPGVQSANSLSLGDIVDGDSYTSPTLTLSSGKATNVGISSLTGATLSGKIMAAPGGTEYNIATLTVVNAANFQVTFGWTTNPLPSLGSTTSTTWYVDIRATSGSTTVTLGRYTFNQVWKR